MTKTFTENDLLRFIYKDLSPKEQQEIEQSLLTDHNLSEKLKVLESTFAELNSVKYAAPKRAVENILFFSKNLEITGV